MLLEASPDGFSGASRDNKLLLRYTETLAAYFGRRRDELAYLFGRVMTSSNPEALFKDALSKRGLLPPAADRESTDEQRNRVGISVTTSFFLVALFHISRIDQETPPTDAEIAALVESVHSVCAHGLAFPQGFWARTDYAELEKTAALSVEETAAPDGLLPAVASVVADVGAWHASMEMVAKRSGLSKSGLYAHFKSKEDMLSRLFITEFERISAVMADRCAHVQEPSDRLYVAIATAASYLLARPDVLIALDWVRTQRLDLGRIMPESLNRSFSFLKEGAVNGKISLLPGGYSSTMRWLLFLTVHQLVRCRNLSVDLAEVHLKLRTLHAFILNGLGEP